jgi:exonuclease VII large subunit
LLLAALLLADELSDIRSATPDENAARLTQSLVSLAERVESLAERLEQDAPTP